MTDDPTKRGAQDRSRISLEQEHEVRYWTQKFGVTKERLAEAVEAVGHSAKAVEEFLVGPRVRVPEPGLQGRKPQSTGPREED